MASSRLVLLLVSAPLLASALPLPATPEASPPPIFALWLCLPFVVLAAVKLTYMNFRRAQSIHACATESSGSAKLPTKSHSFSSFRGLGFSMPAYHQRASLWGKDITGYLVGIFGSPAWETRIRRRVDRVVRQSIGNASGVVSPRISLFEHHSVSDNTRTSKGTASVSQPDTTMSSHRQSRHSSRHSGPRRPRSASVSFLEMQTPKIPAIDLAACEMARPNIGPDASLGLQTASVRNDNRKSGEDRWRRRRLSMSYFSPVSMRMEPPPIPVTLPADPPKRSLDKSVKSSSDGSHNRSYSKTPSFHEASMSSNVSSESVASLPSREITVDLSCTQAPSSPHPEASILSYPHSVSESLDEFSYILNAESSRPIDWSVEEVMKVPKHTPRRPTGSMTLEATDTSSHSPSLMLLQDRITKDPRDSVGSNAGSLLLPRPASGSPVVLMPVPQHPATESQQHGSKTQLSASDTRKDWILEDLLKDGKLDVDAVSGILGLDLEFLDDLTPNSDSIFGNISNLSDAASPGRDGMGWGRAAQSGSTSFDIQIRKPGGPLCVIPEETEDDVSSRRGSTRWSGISGSISARYSRWSARQDEGNTSWVAA